ncbi:hypothethical protein (plasmid) [Ralstonia solanacearum Po82]|uniref:Hypothethical protein n=1 Tax=Ralstonia solanacearum (strain Po82) TaxID=1031711 RepID=F6G7J4_RALS8|nr:hypothethical protein [Ralstonia solanacearum Po82]EUJ13044.1 hypothetical protein RSP673_17855 [Ralstonia solanacearum P673]
MPFRMGARMDRRGRLVFRLSSIVIVSTGNKGTFVPISEVDALIERDLRFLF